MSDLVTVPRITDDQYRWLAIYQPVNNQPSIFAEDDWHFPCVGDHPRTMDHGFKCIDRERLRSLAWQRISDGAYVTMVVIAPHRTPILFRRKIHLDVLNDGNVSHIIPVLGFQQLVNGHSVKHLTAILPNGAIFTTDNSEEIRWP